MKLCKQYLDFVYVVHVVDAIKKYFSLDEKASGAVLNIGAGVS